MHNTTNEADEFGALPYIGFGIGGLGTGLVVQTPTLLLMPTRWLYLQPLPVLPCFFQKYLMSLLTLLWV